MIKMRKLIGLVLVLALTVALTAGCGGTTPGGDNKKAAETGKPAESERPPIKIGVITDKSGVLQNYGKQQVNGLRLGLEYATGGTMAILGRKIELIIEDDGSNPEKGVQAVRKLFEQDKIDLLQGTDSSGVALAVIPEVEKNKKIFMVDPAAADAITGANYSRYVFRTGRNVSQDSLAGGKFLVEKGKKFMNFAPDYAFGKDSAAAWSSVIKANGGEMIGDIFAPQETKDFTSYLQRLAAAKPDGVMVTWAGAGAVQLFQQIAELGLYQKMTVFTGIGDIPSLKAMGTASEGLVGVNTYFHLLPKNQVNDWLVKEHKERFKEPPDLFTSGGFAAGVAIIEGLKKAGSTDAEAMIKALEGMSFETPKGTMTFRPEDHQALQAMYVVQLKKAQGFDYLIPTLIKELSPQETAPPIKNKK